MSEIYLLGAVTDNQTGQVKGYSFYFVDTDEVREYSPLTTAIILNKILLSDRERSKSVLESVLFRHTDDTLQGTLRNRAITYDEWVNQKMGANLLVSMCRNVEVSLTVPAVYVLECYYHDTVVLPQVKVIVRGEYKSRMMSFSELLSSDMQCYGLGDCLRTHNLTYASIKRAVTTDKVDYTCDFIPMPTDSDFVKAYREPDISAFDVELLSTSMREVLKAKNMREYIWDNVAQTTVIHRSSDIGYVCSVENKGIMVCARVGAALTKNEIKCRNTIETLRVGSKTIVGIYAYAGVPLFVEYLNAHSLHPLYEVQGTTIAKVSEFQDSLNYGDIFMRFMNMSEYSTISRYNLKWKQGGQST